MSQKIWEINGLSLELDLGNADVMERYENAFDEMGEAEKQLPKDGKGSVRIRAYCRLFRDLYDRIFGGGTSEKIFKGIPDSTDAYDEVYCAFLEFVAAQKTAAIAEKSERFSKYKPNRQQRRSAKKKK